MYVFVSIPAGVGKTLESMLHQRHPLTHSNSYSNLPGLDSNASSVTVPPRPILLPSSKPGSPHPLPYSSSSFHTHPPSHSSTTTHSTLELVSLNKVLLKCESHGSPPLPWDIQWPLNHNLPSLSHDTLW